ncbi:MAG: radical SAM protein [Deltaproteobacteria bacterium]|nr:radical SAM protein [Deltaproteobacteria bacterium]
MRAQPACSLDVPRGAGRAQTSPNLLRLERFGAFHYHRQETRFTPIPPREAQLLAESARTGANVLECASGLWTDAELVQLALRWKASEIVDGDLICHAKIIDTDRSHGGLVGPMVTHLQLTQQCNLRCKHCFVDIMAKPGPNELTTDELRAVFLELQTIGSPLVVLAGGEPMMRPDFFEIVESLAEVELDAWLCTNATLIDDEAARRLAASPLRGLSISLDGPDAETHDFLRGRGQFRRATKGIRAVVEAGHTDVKLRVTVNPHNLERLVDFAGVAKELGVHKVVFKPFRRTGLATDPSLLVPRAQYYAGIDAAAARWPEDAPPADFDDGMPSRPPEWTRIIPSFGCVGGTTLATVVYDGRVVACDALLSERDWTVRSHGFAACWRRSPAVASWRALEESGECGSCDNFKECGGACRARAVGAGRTMKDPDPWARCSENEPSMAARRLPVVA